MKTINNRYVLANKVKEYENYTLYDAYDRFTNTLVFLRIFNKETHVFFKKDELLRFKMVEHENIFKFYNFENVWFVDGNLAYTDYYVLISEHFPYENLLRLDEISISIDSLKHILEQFFSLLFYLHKYDIYLYDLDFNKIIVLPDYKIKLNPLFLDVKNKFDKKEFNLFLEKLFDKFKEFFKEMPKELFEMFNRIVSKDFSSLLELIDYLEEKENFKLNRFSYITKKKKWSTKELGFAVHYEILQSLYQFQSKRRNKIAFIFFGSDDSIKNAVINDFLEYLKYEQYIKFEIIMQNFYDFLKYLFDVLEHYHLTPDKERKIKRYFENYNKTLNDEYLLKIQNDLVMMLFEFSSVKKVVLNLKNVVGIDDRIVKFINLILHIPVSGNIILLFDAQMEKQRFMVFYKKSQFEIVTKEYGSLNEDEKCFLLRSIFCSHGTEKDFLKLINKYDKKTVFSILSFIKKIYKKKYIYHTKRCEFFIDYETIEKDKEYLLDDDTIESEIQYLNEEEIAVLWYLSKSRKTLTLDDFVFLLRKPKDSVLTILGRMRSYAFIEEIWEGNVAYYKIVKDDFVSYFNRFAVRNIKNYKARMVKFLDRNRNTPEAIVNLIDFLMQDNAYYSAIRYIYILTRNYGLIEKEEKVIFEYLNKILFFPKSFEKKWEAHASYFAILSVRNEYDEILKFLEKIVPEYIANAKKINSFEMWYFFGFYYSLSINRKNMLKKKLLKIKNIGKNIKNDSYKVLVMKATDFFIEEDDYRKKDIVVNILEEKNFFKEEYAFFHFYFQMLYFLFSAGFYELFAKYKDSYLAFLNKSDELYARLFETKFYNTVGNYYLNIGVAEKAKIMFEKSLEIAEAINDYRRMILAHNNIAAALYYMKYDTNTQMEEFKTAVSIGKKVGEMKRVVVALSNIADGYLENLYYKKAYENIGLAFRYVDKKDTLTYSIILMQLFDILLYMGDYKKARYVFRLYKKTVQKTKDFESLISLPSLMGKFYFLKGNYEKSLEYYENYLEEVEKNEFYNYDYFDASIDCIHIFLKQGKKTKAKKIYSKLIKIKSTFEVDTADLNLEFYKIHFISDIDKKIAILEKFLMLYKKEQNSRKILETLLILVELYIEKDYKYRLYEVATEVLFYLNFFKRNFDRHYLSKFNKSYYASMIFASLKSISSYLDIDEEKITYNMIKEKWEQFFNVNIFNFFKKTTNILISEWQYSFNDIDKIINSILEYISDIARADRVVLFVKNEKQEFVRNNLVVKRDVFAPNEFRYDLITQNIKKPDELLDKSYLTYSSHIVKAGVFPIFTYGFSQGYEDEEKRKKRKEISNYIRGVLYFDSKKYCNNITDSINPYIFPLVQYLNLLLEYKDIQKELVICPLTGVLTRTYFLNSVEKLLKQRVQNETIGFMVIDIDQMAKINLKYGNDIGDEIIKEVAFVIKNSVRSYDLIGRYMGEEFILVFPDIKKNELLDKASFMKKEIEKNEFMRKYDVTVTVGLSLLPEHGKEIEILISKAITALNSAKGNKNKIEIWHEGYGFSTGRHDLLAGIWDMNIVKTEVNVRNIVELIMLEENDAQFFFNRLLIILKRIFVYDYIFAEIVCSDTKKFIYKDKDMILLDKYVRKARKTENALIILNWRYQKEQGIFSDLIFSDESGGISVTLYFSSKMDKKEYSQNDANLLKIIGRIVVGHTKHFILKERDID